MKNFMKTQTIFLSLILLPVILSNFGCKDKNAKPVDGYKIIGNDDEHNNDTATLWQLSFYFIDTLGNNLVPCELPDTPYLNPKDYIVICDSASDHFYYKFFNYKVDSFGHVFSFGELRHIIRASSQYQIDSTYKVKVCFANKCYTVISRIYSHKEQTEHYSKTKKHLYDTKWVLWNGDTIFTVSPDAIPIIIKQ